MPFKRYIRCCLNLKLPWCLFDLLVSLLIDWIFLSFDQNWSDLKVIPSKAKKNMLRANKHKLFGSRVAHFWTRIWPGRGDGLRAGTEDWDDGNFANGDWYKTPGSDGETSNMLKSDCTLFNL